MTARSVRILAIGAAFLAGAQRGNSGKQAAFGGRLLARGDIAVGLHAVPM